MSTGMPGRKAAFTTALVLLIPLLGNHFVDGWSWQPRGFVLFGTLVFGAAMAYELITRNAAAIPYRAAVGVALVASFILVWMNFVQLADDVDPAAALFFGVPIVGIIGAFIARFRPRGMTRALFATAIAQACVLAIVMIRITQVASSALDVARPFGLNAFLLVLFAASAWLFRKAAA